jgi:hypothetical protein
MADRNVLDFIMQSEQMVDIIENRLGAGQRQMAIDLLVLKFKALYELGVASGRLYETEGVYPFASTFSPEDRR